MTEQTLTHRLYESFETEQLQGFSRSIAQLHWLLLVLVLLYYFVPTGPLDDTDGLIVTLTGYAVVVGLCRLLHGHSGALRLLLAFETLAMISFITLVLTHTGHTESPLLNLYLLVIIACALTLGSVMTVLELLLITTCYLYIGYSHYALDIFAPQTFTTLMAKFSPFLLVAYVTTTLAEDIITAKRRIIHLSQTDEVTGLLNMRAFTLLYEHELQRTRRYRDAYSIAMVDIDGLKTINDRYGHSAGTRLIQAIATAIRQSVRTADVVARYGGDEFIVLMHRTGRDAAIQCAERIREAVCQTAIKANDQRITTTASIGIACFPDSVTEPERVLDKADQALYRSKQDGRNRVTCYDRRIDTQPFEISNTRQYA